MATLAPCAAVAALQTAAFVCAIFRARALGLPNLAPHVVWSVTQGGAEHLARQTARATDGGLVTLATGLAFDTAFGVLRVAPPGTLTAGASATFAQQRWTG